MLEAALRAVGAVCYHDLHPFNDMLHDGKLNKGQVQAWALNRYVYQAVIPRRLSILLTIDRRSPVKSSRSRYARRASSSASLGIGTIEQTRGSPRSQAIKCAQ